MDPKIVPTAKFDCFLIAATIPVASSGKDVPKATKVKPIIDSEKPKDMANSLEPIIKYLDP